MSNQDLKLCSDATNTTLFLHPSISLNISRYRQRKLRCASKYRTSVCIPTSVSVSNLMLTFALDLFCNFFYLVLSLFFWNVIHSKGSGDSSVFSDHACDFLLQHLIFHMSMFFFCLHGESRFLHLLKY